MFIVGKKKKTIFESCFQIYNILNNQKKKAKRKYQFVIVLLISTLRIRPISITHIHSKN